MLDKDAAVNYKDSKNLVALFIDNLSPIKKVYLSLMLLAIKNSLESSSLDFTSIVM